MPEGKGQYRDFSGELYRTVGEALLQETIKIKSLINASNCQTTVTSRCHQSLGKDKTGTMDRGCSKLEPKVWLLVWWGVLACPPCCATGAEVLSIPQPLNFLNIFEF